MDSMQKGDKFSNGWAIKLLQQLVFEIKPAIIIVPTSI